MGYWWDSAWLEDRDNVLCANKEWMHAMLYTTPVQFVRTTLGFLLASFSLSISETLLHVENTNHRLLGTPSSVSKECSQAYINCQNLLNLFSQHPHRGLRVSLQVSNPG